MKWFDDKIRQKAIERDEAQAKLDSGKYRDELEKMQLQATVANRGMDIEDLQEKRKSIEDRFAQRREGFSAIRHNLEAEKF